MRFTSQLTPELCCSNIKASLFFYTEILGFKIKHQREEERFAMLERQGAWLMLEQIDTSSRSWITGPLEFPFGRGLNLEIMTTNVDQLYDCVQKAEAKIFLPIEEKWYRAGEIEVGNRQFIVLDPDGYLLRFAQDLGERALVV
ncbi:MAG: VOC family protein [Legionella sp.]|nr:MAG: VOC family protein [Legionella sp.]